MTKPLRLELDRSAKTPLAEQIRKGIGAAIESGVLAPGARLPSWQDLAAQLGVARGTVRTAYEKLSAAQLIVASRATGTRVADRPSITIRQEEAPDPGSFIEMYQELTTGPAIFQMGVPAQETFPAKLIARMRAHAVRAESSAPAIYPDPRGEPELRREIAGYLAIARGIECSSSQIIITAGFSGGLGLALRALGLEGRKVWVEDPRFSIHPAWPRTREIVACADPGGCGWHRCRSWPAPCARRGAGCRHPRTAGAARTHAVAGTAFTPARLAAQEGAWVIEDDYLGELQLNGRAAPALASLDRAGRVIHIGSFSKTLTPTLRLGFVVAPSAVATQFAEVAASLAPAPGPSVQLATAEFMRDGHYMRHLRRTKRVYAAQRDALLKYLRPRVDDISIAGLAVLLRLPNGAPDRAIARETLSFGLAPAPLSLWSASTASVRSGLLLGIATSPHKRLAASCDRLSAIIDRLS